MSPRKRRRHNSVTSGTAKEPTWWQYIGGRDADRRWAGAYVVMAEQSRGFPPLHRKFYLAAITRLSADAYPKPAHRLPDPVNFWLACHYHHGMIVKTSKAAAVDTARLASSAGIARGH